MGRHIGDARPRLWHESLWGRLDCGTHKDLDVHSHLWLQDVVEHVDLVVHLSDARGWFDYNPHAL